jgi:hypothetical protein
LECKTKDENIQHGLQVHTVGITTPSTSFQLNNQNDNQNNVMAEEWVQPTAVEP